MGYDNWLEEPYQRQADLQHRVEIWVEHHAKDAYDELLADDEIPASPSIHHASP